MYFTGFRGPVNGKENTVVERHGESAEVTAKNSRRRVPKVLGKGRYEYASFAFCWTGAG